MNSPIFREGQPYSSSFQMRTAERRIQIGIVLASQLTTPEARARQLALIAHNVGNTPLLRDDFGKRGTIWVKDETANPFSESHYDRASLVVLQTLEDRGIIKPGDKILEGSSGSAGRSIAAFCEMEGYQLDIIVPYIDPVNPNEGDFPEARARDIRALGANVISADERGGIQKVQSKWKREVVKLRSLARKGIGTYKEVMVEGKPIIVYKNGTETICAPNHSEIIITPRAFGNIAREVLDQLPQGVMIDTFIGTLGNGATVKGISEVLREVNPNLRVIGTETKEAPTNSIRKIKWELIKDGVFTSEQFDDKNPDPKALETLRQVFKKRYNRKMPSKNEQTYHDSFGASTPGYEPPFVEVDKIDHIVLLDDEWRDLHRRVNTYAYLNNNPINIIGNTSAENLYVAGILAELESDPRRNYLVLRYDKADQYETWPPELRKYTYPRPKPAPDVIPYSLLKFGSTTV